MPFIGKEPLNAFNTPTKDSFNGDGSTVAFTLSRSVALASDLEVFVDNVQQEPTSAYTVSGTTLSFTGTPATGTNNIYAVHRSGGMQTLTAPTGTAGDFSTINASGAATFSGAATVGGDLTVTGNIIGDIEITGTTPKLTIGDAGAEDSTLQFDGNAQDFYIALDDSADDLLIGLGSTVGTTPALAIDENLLATFHGGITMAGTTPTLTIGDAGAEDTKIVFDGNAKDFYIGLDDSADKLVIGEGSTVGTNSILTITDDAVTIGDAAAVDSKLVFDGNAQDYYIALDDSADDLVIGKGSALGTTPAISVDENLKTQFGGGAVGKTSTANATGNTTLDYDANSNFVLTATGNVTLVNPTTETVGQTGIIVFIQDGTGSRTLSTGTQYEWPAGTAGTISTAANSVDVIPYVVDAADSILLGAPQLAFATPS